MIAKILNRVDFGGIVNYAHNDKNKKKQANLLDYEGVCATDNKAIANSFYIQASMRPNRRKPVKHISLSFSPRDADRFPDNREGDELMAKIAKEWMKRMGIVHTQYIIARHHDTHHPHCHIVYNLVGNEGQIISDSNERYRSARICKALTEEYGLYIARKNSKEQNLDRLRSHQRQKAQLRAAVMDARQESTDWNSFLNALSRRNVSVQVTTDRATDKVVGLSFSMEDARCSGYRLDPSLSYPHFVIAFGQALEEILFQPHAQSLDCSGSPVNNQGWRNRDDEEAKKNRKAHHIYQPSKRRRK